VNRPESYEPAPRILIVDDHDLVREGLRSLMAAAGIEIVAEAEDGESAIRLAMEHDVDVVLLDIRLPDRPGLEVLAHLKREKPNLPVLIYSMHDKPHYIERSVAFGAAGYFVKGIGNDALVTAIRSARENRNAMI
jgi:two-component system NarL family response regulator